jgi:hypothetical protein
MIEIDVVSTVDIADILEDLFGLVILKVLVEAVDLDIAEEGDFEIAHVR